MQRTPIFDQKLLADIQALSANIKQAIATPSNEPVKINKLEKAINNLLEKINLLRQGNTLGMPLDILANFAFDCSRYYHFQLTQLFESIKFNYKNIDPESKNGGPLPNARLTMHSSQAFYFNPNLFGSTNNGLQQRLQFALNVTRNLFEVTTKTNFSQKQLNDLENKCNKFVNLIADIADTPEENPGLNPPVDKLPQLQNTSGNARLLEIERRWKEIKEEIPKLVALFNKVKRDLEDPFLTDELQEMQAKKRKYKIQIQNLKAENERLIEEHLTIRQTRQLIETKDPILPLTAEEKEAEAKELADHIARGKPQLRPNLSRKALKKLALGFYREKEVAKLESESPFQVSAEILFQTSVKALIALDPTPEKEHSKALEKLLTRLDEIENELSIHLQKLEEIETNFTLTDNIRALQTAIQKLEKEERTLTKKEYRKHKKAILAALTLEQLEIIAEDAFRTRFRADDQLDPNPIEDTENEFDLAVKQWWEENIELNIPWSNQMLPPYPWFKNSLLRLKLATEDNDNLILTPKEKSARVQPRLGRVTRKSAKKSKDNSDFQQRKRKSKDDSSDSESESQLRKPRQAKPKLVPAVVSLKPKSKKSSKKRSRVEDELPNQPAVMAKEPALKKAKTTPSVASAPATRAVEEKKDLGALQFEFSKYQAEKIAFTNEKDSKKPRKKANESHLNICSQDEYKTFMLNILNPKKAKDVIDKLKEPHKQIFANVPSADSIDFKGLNPLKNSIGWGFTPLCVAAINPACPQEVIDFLLEKGADYNYVINYSKQLLNGCSILMLACLFNNERMVDTLLKKSVNLHFVNSRKGQYQNWTAFECAVSSGNIEIVRRLLNFHALMDTKEGPHIWESALENAPVGSREAIRALINRYYEERDLFLASDAQAKVIATSAVASMDMQEDKDAAQTDDQNKASLYSASGAGAGAGAGSVDDVFPNPRNTLSENDNSSDSEYEDPAPRSKTKPVAMKQSIVDLTNSASDSDEKDSKAARKSLLKSRRRQHFSRSPSRAIDAPRAGLMYGSPKTAPRSFSPKRSTSGDSDSGRGPTGLGLFESGLVSGFSKVDQHGLNPFEDNQIKLAISESLGQASEASPSYPNPFSQSGAGAGSSLSLGQTRPLQAGYNYPQNGSYSYTGGNSQASAQSAAGAGAGAGAGSGSGQTYYSQPYQMYNPNSLYPGAPGAAYLTYSYQQSVGYMSAPLPASAQPGASVGGGSSLTIGQRLAQAAATPSIPSMGAGFNGFAGQTPALQADQPLQQQGPAFVLRHPLPEGFAYPPLAGAAPQFDPRLFGRGSQSAGIASLQTPGNGIAPMDDELDPFQKRA